jgi:predicted nucleic acid-binding protein
VKSLTKDRFFMDTNLIVYLFDKKDGRKQPIARDLLKEALENRNGMISFQVIQEFCNVALRKFETPLSPDDLMIFINRFLFPICDVLPGLEIYNTAVEIHKSFGYGFYDSLIIAAARDGNCAILYSEDLQHGQQVLGINIVNPFMANS